MVVQDFTTYSVEYEDIDGDGEFEYASGRGAVSEVVFEDDYNNKDKRRNLWVGLNVRF